LHFGYCPAQLFWRKLIFHRFDHIANRLSSIFRHTGHKSCRAGCNSCCLFWSNVGDLFQCGVCSIGCLLSCLGPSLHNTLLLFLKFLSNMLGCFSSCRGSSTHLSPISIISNNLNLNLL